MLVVLERINSGLAGVGGVVVVGVVVVVVAGIVVVEVTIVVVGVVAGFVVLHATVTSERAISPAPSSIRQRILSGNQDFIGLLLFYLQD